jgi:hypothetical protein
MTGLGARGPEICPVLKAAADWLLGLYADWAAISKRWLGTAIMQGRR